MQWAADDEVQFVETRRPQNTIRLFDEERVASRRRRKTKKGRGASVFGRIVRPDFRATTRARAVAVFATMTTDGSVHQATPWGA